MHAKNIFQFSLFSFLIIISTHSFAQKSYKDIRDSLIAEGIIKETSQSFYVKPIFEQYQSIVSIQGSGFSKPNADFVRKRGFGIRVGYQQRSYEIETGLSMIRPIAGFRYASEYGYTTRGGSTDFYHVPLVFRYRVWVPIKHLSLYVGIGAAYNFDLDKVKFPPELREVETKLDANGNQTIFAITKSRYDQEESFFSGEVNISGRYRISSHFSAGLEVRRLISRNDIVRLRATEQSFAPPMIREFASSGGANSYSINFGIAYKFGATSRYRLD